ncbi:MAG TPA: hypothetical protein VMW43_11400 [Bacteroidota bacterium]|nr:hypothetical protein [Bacteroidota bacterium]
MRRKISVFLLLLCIPATGDAQVFGLRRPNVWYLTTQPALGFFLGHSGMDLSSGTTVSDVFRWGAGLDMKFGANMRKLSFNNSLRLQYVESHTTDQQTVRGPSVFEFATRPVYGLLRDTAVTLGAAFQGGCNTALAQETDGSGRTTRKFFDPASVYEGLFLSTDAVFGDRHELQMSVQLGYSLQQLVYQTAGENTGGDLNQSGNWSGGGSTAFFTVAYNRKDQLSANQTDQISFFTDLSVKIFRKETGFQDLTNSRVEGTMRMGFALLQFLDFLTTADLIYDSNISPRRELRTSVSLNFTYNIDLGGGL